ncbi:hemerythrin domain-containing protein [Actinokineospora xionganensis]|uniref:Hemerythrin domain-containing protein n=1 Tax=Actinokineospora xionganensis TaxID=2684470 RepID=A0ABR7KYS1_9PSEU|nr:hemerythrin domain-containing protein [Actinokineospora xionganensis]MBC6445600.1 hemerythrin domain-containing protein [Actinokineospora xionganensis]
MALGNQLIEIHIWLREELTDLRADVDAYIEGTSDRQRSLRAHCLTFCSALTRHHTGEDVGAFAALEAEFPDLGPVLAELRRDHVLVEDALRRLQSLVDSLSETADPARTREIRGDLDTLAALIETHFTYEEKRLVVALNELEVAAATEDLLGVVPPD